LITNSSAGADLVEHVLGGPGAGVGLDGQLAHPVAAQQRQEGDPQRDHVDDVERMLGEVQQLVDPQQVLGLPQRGGIDPLGEQHRAADADPRHQDRGGEEEPHADGRQSRPALDRDPGPMGPIRRR
jgi:hypothetical protein